MGFTKKVIIGVIALAVVGGVSIGTALYRVAALDGDGAVINIAGRQRMLAQKMTKEYLLFKKTRDSGDLKKTVQLFDHSLNLLLTGSAEENIPSPTPETGEKLRVAQTTWKVFKKNLDLLMKGTDDAEAISKAEAFIVGNNVKLLKQSNAVVQTLEGQSKSKIATLNWVLFISLGVLATVGTVLIILVIRSSSKVETAIRKMKHSAAETLDSGKQLKEVSNRVSKGATEQATSIHQTVSTLDEISAMVDQGVEGATKTTELSQGSLRAATDGKEAVVQMTQSMDEISTSNHTIMNQIDESNRQISEIVKVINEISEKTKIINDIVFQTKLLSFNASVEAARAGEHGKGFAVVAEEVGSLAAMSGNAAKEIGDMLGASIEKVEGIVENTKSKVSRLIEDGKRKVESGVATTGRCGKVLDEVLQNVNQVNSMMSGITNASREQAEGVSNISTAMNQLDQLTQVNTQVADQTSQVSRNLATEAEALKIAVEELEKELIGALKQVNKNVNPPKKPSSSNKGDNVVSIGDSLEKASMFEHSFAQA